MATLNQQNLSQASSAYAENFAFQGLASPPAKKYAGIPLGDAHVIRNAGGSAVESLRSLIISEQLLGTNEIFVIKHTGCGMLTFKNEDVRGIVGQVCGPEGGAEVANLDFLPFPELDQAVKDDIAFLKASKSIPDSVIISGWVYEVESGRTRQVA